MKLRTIKTTVYAREFQMGSMRVKQPLPSRHAEQVSPFILLHHAGPTPVEAGRPSARISPHPHRGFEPVTFVFSGKIHHRDSLGNEGFLQAGDVQWMTAGRGVIHSEGPSEQFAAEGGIMEIVQLWINLPRKDKMTAPRYQDIPSSLIPQMEMAGGKWKLKVVAGEFMLEKGPAKTFSPIQAVMIEFEAGATVQLPVPQNFNTMIYVLDGKLEVNEQPVAHRNMVEFANDGDAIQLTSVEKGKMLFLAGEPINEPLVSYGPFVMNTQEEIQQAVLDYETGKMGNLDF
ncbi:MAG: pirin family protein [Bacteroidia bacterium]|nr:pirin family protein [Bacteroidia bacterium]